MPTIEKTVFISYRHNDEPWALAINQYLTNLGYDVFIDFTGLASGNFESAIVANIESRAHFLVLLTPSALERCGNPEDWLRREIETALKTQRNIVPVMLEGFDFNAPTVTKYLKDALAELQKYNGLAVPKGYFLDAMARLRHQFLDIPVDVVLRPASRYAQQAAQDEQVAARRAFQKNTFVSRPAWLRTLFIPFVVVSILLVALVGYCYLYWVPDRERVLDDRNFRYLKTLSDQVGLAINAIVKTTNNAVEAGNVTAEQLSTYLSNVAPHLVVPDSGETGPVFGHDFDDPPTIAITVNQGRHYLYLGFMSYTSKEPFNYAIRTDLNKLIDGLLGPPELSPFDIVLVAENSGRVIFEKAPAGLEIVRLQSLPAFGEEKGIDVGSLLQTSRLAEVRIAGARYRLFSQPLQINLRTADPLPRPAKPGSKSTDDGFGPWVVCGLVRADRFRSESQLILGHLSLATVLFWSTLTLLAIAWLVNRFVRRGMWK